MVFTKEEIAPCIFTIGPSMAESEFHLRYDGTIELLEGSMSPIVDEPTIFPLSQTHPTNLQKM